VPVIDETIHTAEIKNLRKQLQEEIDSLKKRVLALEGAKK